MRRANSSCLKLAAMAAMLTLVAGCDSHAEAASPKRLQPGTYEGYVVPGRMMDAKTMGFTDCKPEYLSFQCSAAKRLTLLGVAVRAATLRLEYRDYFSTESLPPEVKPEDRTPERLNYQYVRLEIGRTSYNEKCVRKVTQGKAVWPNPIECRASNEGVDYLQFRLEQDGWKQTSGRRSRTFLKAGVPVSITIGGIGNDEAAVIRQIEATDRDASLATLNAKAGAEAERVQKERAVLDAMKK